MAPCLENGELKTVGSDSGQLLADLLDGARRRNFSANSLLAYEPTWKGFLAWSAAASRSTGSFFPAAKGAANLKQIRAALSFAYGYGI